jgi:hypothetical protein
LYKGKHYRRKGEDWFVCSSCSLEAAVEGMSAVAMMLGGAMALWVLLSKDYEVAK